METDRFETFFDAIIAIIITVLVLKIPQPTAPTLSAVLELQTIYIAYLISFLILYNIWYSNHNLFQLIENIDNTTLLIYAVMTFIISLLPYFTIWLANLWINICCNTHSKYTCQLHNIKKQSLQQNSGNEIQYLLKQCPITSHNNRIHNNLHSLCSGNLYNLSIVSSFMDYYWQNHKEV